VLETGYRFGLPAKLKLEPLAAFQYVHLTQSAFQESNAGSLSLSVDEADVDSLLLTLAARLSRLYTLRGDYGIEPELRLGWSHDFGDLDRHVAALFGQVPGSDPFVTAGAEPDRDVAWIGLGYVMSLGDVPMLSTHYDLRIGKRTTTHMLTVGTYFRW
jgi:outer membrane autotransporter protein